ncbi:hypothetical protein JHK82_030254 [Glycine max]|uniref:Uncharacterized protein n=2 Tax=Glycine subgen. Soja TaxID=1462606 RepID=K7LNE5_SOYBN|nr:hypothetical protein JHK87_030149 [Glycine soja]KAG4987903.1 hypothetical protein JHK85_030886 [Glycine max]KAG4993521.1 hypothetical protein JHK86_030348 [Glycine max]KAG5123517.1 hypothetical protein JHK82_030254 [Glycine max]KAG5144941.1 hypothetical protein JHK84_030484 [Glycine max]
MDRRGSGRSHYTYILLFSSLSPTSTCIAFDYMMQPPSSLSLLTRMRLAVSSPR